MKKIIISLFIIFTLFGINTKVNANTCNISNVEFSQITGSGWFEENYTNLTINTSNCGDGIKIQLKAINESGQHVNARIDDLPFIFFPEDSTGIIRMKLKIDESTCYGNNNENDPSPNWGHECIAYLEISNNNNEPIYSGNEPELTAHEVKNGDVGTYRAQGVLLGNCNLDGCGSGLVHEDDVDNWDYIELFNGTAPNPSTCTLSNSGSGIQDVYFDTVSGNSVTDKNVKLNIKTSGKCDLIPLKIQLWEEDAGPGNDNTIDIENSEDGDFITVVPNVGEDLYVVYKGNEDDCEGSGDPDCKIYVEIFKEGNRIFSSKDYLSGDLNSTTFQQNTNFKKGVIALNCQTTGDCRNTSNDWRYQDTNGELADEEGQPSSVVIQQPTFDPNSPCYNTATQEYRPDCYELLTPIPGLQSTDSAGNNNVIESGGRVAINDLGEFKLGDYINSIFQIALGILMVLAVIMIVVGGVQYMTTEAIFQKQVAREYITKAVLGLILALGIFIILNTINPRLLQIDFDQKIETITIDAGDGGVEPEGNSEFGISSTNSNCAEYATINQPDALQVTRFDVCKPIEQDVIDLLAAAKQDGIILTAYGARSRQRQIQLRQQNCGTSSYDINQKPPSQCSPPTAKPGTSWHESGFALDFLCVLNGQEGTVNVHAGNTNGTKRTWTQPCWNWLRNNATQFGFQNIQSENWHWNSSKRS